MVRGRLFSKSKKENIESKYTTINDIEKKPLAEYKETLYTGAPKCKKEAYAFSNQRIWRDVQTIEKNIDIIHITRAKKPVNDLDRVVDRIIAKKKK
jgi:hypothetical protein